MARQTEHPFSYEVYEGQHEHNLDELYSWMMNNFWEINFKASLGDFYEFTYHFISGTDLKDPKKAIEACKQLNSGAIVFRYGQATCRTL